MLRHGFTKNDEIRLKDRNCINLDEYYDIEYWAAKFGVTPELLKLAVENSGTTVAEEVERYISNNYVSKK